MLTSLPRALKGRMTPTLAICILAGGFAAIGLALPAISPLPAPANPYAAPVPAAPSGGTGDGPAAVEIVDFAFAGDLQVAPGQTIEVTNVDGVPHTLTANDGSFDTGTLAGRGVGLIQAPTQAGTYDFICTIHPSMTGRLTVTES